MARPPLVSTNHILRFSATTIRFSLSSPQLDGGLPIRYYVGQYKPVHLSWNEALNRTWAIGNFHYFLLCFLRRGWKRSETYYPVSRCSLRCGKPGASDAL